MKALAAVLATLLLVAICSCTTSSPQLDTAFTATQCCFRHTKVIIRPRSIAYAYITSSSCPLPAVVVVTKSRQEVCVDPEALWVQKYLRNMEKLNE
ncbi:C-C motif chemokine 3-like 1 [Melanerpes formicivorus]|uniref:C-C motif chemokine 3-like 1 n=1 Tax=Melanerpes formicivorus TaxID=211600 RepID=UPI00358F91F8